jgi:hypothetical protein
VTVFQTTDGSSMAVMAGDGPPYKWRYLLRRAMDGGGAGRLLWVMLNPSTADHVEDDATIRKCRGFTARLGRFAEFEVVNLYALRSKDKRDLRRLALPAAAVGPENDAYIAQAAARADRNIVAWGTDPGPRKRRPAEVRALLREHGRAEPEALRVTAGGEPGHPLMLGYSNQPQPYRR